MILCFSITIDIQYFISFRLDIYMICEVILPHKSHTSLAPYIVINNIIDYIPYAVLYTPMTFVTASLYFLILSTFHTASNKHDFKTKGLWVEIDCLSAVKENIHKKAGFKDAVYLEVEVWASYCGQKRDISFFWQVS